MDKNKTTKIRVCIANLKGVETLNRAMAQATTLLSQGYLDDAEFSKVCNGDAIYIEDVDAGYEKYLMIPAVLNSENDEEDDFIPTWRVEEYDQKDRKVIWAKIQANGRLAFDGVEKDEKVIRVYLDAFDKLAFRCQEAATLEAITSSEKRSAKAVTENYRKIFRGLRENMDLTDQEKAEQAHELVMNEIKRTRTGDSQIMEGAMIAEWEELYGVTPTEAELAKAGIALVPIIYRNVEMRNFVRSCIDIFCANDDVRSYLQTCVKAAQEALKASKEEKTAPQAVPAQPAKKPAPQPKAPQPAKKTEPQKQPQKPKPQQKRSQAQPAEGVYAGEWLVEALNNASVAFGFIPSAFHTEGSTFSREEAEKLMKESGVGRLTIDRLLH